MSTVHPIQAKPVQDASHHAVNEIYLRYRKLVFNICMLELRNFDDALDATQAVFLILMKNSKKLSARTDVAGWLCITAKNVCKNAKRAQTRSNRQQSMNELEEMPSPESDANPLLVLALDQAVIKLSPKEQASIGLRYWENLSIREVADRLKISESAAQMRINRALTKLQNQLKGRGFALTPLAVGNILKDQAYPTPPDLDLTITSTPLTKAVIRQTRWVAKSKVAAILIGSSLFLVPLPVLARYQVNPTPAGYGWFYQEAYYQIWGNRTFTNGKVFELKPNSTRYQQAWLEILNNENILEKSYVIHAIFQSKTEINEMGIRIRHTTFGREGTTWLVDDSPAIFEGDPNFDFTSGRARLIIDTDRSTQAYDLDITGNELKLTISKGGSINSLAVMDSFVGTHTTNPMPTQEKLMNEKPLRSENTNPEAQIAKKMK